MVLDTAKAPLFVSNFMQQSVSVTSLEQHYVTRLP